MLDFGNRKSSYDKMFTCSDAVCIPFQQIIDVMKCIYGIDSIVTFNVQ